MDGVDTHAAPPVSPSSGELKGASTDDIVKYPCSADMYEVLGEIGQGAFATVYRARVKGRTVWRWRREIETSSQGTNACYTGRGCHQDH